jgi:hypothetical protein
MLEVQQRIAVRGSITGEEGLAYFKRTLTSVWIEAEEITPTRLRVTIFSQKAPVVVFSAFAARPS